MKCYSIFEDKQLLALVGGPERFRDSFSCSSEEFEKVRETWKEHKREEAEAMENLLVEALGPVGASEESLQSFKKWLKDEDVNLASLSGVKNLKDIDAGAHARKAERSPQIARQNSRLSTTSRTGYSQPRISHSVSRTAYSRSSQPRISLSKSSRTRSRTVTASRSAGVAVRTIRPVTRSRRDSRTPARSWPPKRRGRGRVNSRSTYSTYPSNYDRSVRSTYPRTRSSYPSARQSRMPQRVWPPQRSRARSEGRRSVPVPTKFYRAVNAVVAYNRMRRVR